MFLWLQSVGFVVLSVLPVSAAGLDLICLNASTAGAASLQRKSSGRSHSIWCYGFSSFNLTDGHFASDSVVVCT